jgi:hypothetical protein
MSGRLTDSVSGAADVADEEISTLAELAYGVVSEAWEQTKPTPTRNELILRLKKELGVDLGFARRAVVLMEGMYQNELPSRGYHTAL